MAGYGHALMVSCPLVSIEPQDVFGIVLLSNVQKVTTDHDPRTAFAGLTMHNGHVTFVFVKVLLDFITKWLN